MSIRSKLFLAFSIVLALTVGITAYGIRAISNAEGLVVGLYDQPFMTMSYARAAQAKFSDARRAMERGWLLQGSDRASNDAVVKTAINDMLDDLKIVGERSIKAGRLERVNNAHQLTMSWYEGGLQIHKSAADGLTGVPLSTDVMRQADAVEAAVDQIVEDASAYGFEFRAQAKAKISASQASLITLAVLTIAAGILFSFGIASSFGSAIRNAMTISERIAAGNLSEKVLTARRDELGRLLQSLGKTQEALQRQAENQRVATETKDRTHADQITRRRYIETRIEGFRNSVGKILHQADEMTGRMNLTARTLSTIATEADQQANVAAGAADKTSGNVTLVAAGTEQLDASIREITDRLALAAAVASQATNTANTTKATIFRLAESAERINGVVGLPLPSGQICLLSTQRSKRRGPGMQVAVLL